MKKEKVLTSLAAASMVLTQAGQMSVFAKGATADETDINSTPANKEESKIEKTEKELLQEKIDEAQKKADEAKEAEEKAQKDYDTYNEGIYIPTKANVNTLKSNYDASSLEAQKAIVSELEKQVANLEENQKKLGQANEQKKALQAQLDETTNALADANSKLQEAQKKYDALLNGTSEEEISKDVEEKEKALEEAQKALEEAQNTVSTLAQQKAETEAKVTEATQNVENTQKAYAEAQTSVNEAQKALDTAVANYNEKKAIYDGASDPTIKAQYEADIKNAENELVTAQTNLQVALENQTAKANAVTSAEKNLSDVNQEILNLDAQIAEKQKALDTINQTINDPETP